MLDDVPCATSPSLSATTDIVTKGRSGPCTPGINPDGQVDDDDDGSSCTFVVAFILPGKDALHYPHRLLERIREVLYQSSMGQCMGSDPSSSSWSLIVMVADDPLPSWSSLDGNGGAYIPNGSRIGKSELPLLRSARSIGRRRGASAIIGCYPPILQSKLRLK